MAALSLAASLAVAFGAGCSGSSTAPASTSATPVAHSSASATSSDAPHRSEVTRAIRRLVHPLLKSGQISKVTVYEVGRDARGRWTARAYLTPPPTASCWPSKILVVRRPGGWKTVSVTVDRTFGGRVTPGPIVVLNDLLGLNLL
jgi:hypothetical protein